MSDSKLSKWEEPIPKRENEISANGDKAMSPPGGCIWGRRLSTV